MDEIIAPVLVEVDDDLGVGVGSEDVPPGEEVLLEVGEIENLAVVDDPDRPVLIGDRLLARFEVDDAQPAHAQGGPAVEVGAVVVRAPMDDGLGHRPEEGRRVGAQAPAVHEPADPAHPAHFTLKRGT